MVKDYKAKLQKIMDRNGGFITRADIDKEGIPSGFLYEFIKEKGLCKAAPGFYYDEHSYIADEYYFLQKRYPKYIYCGYSALYLLQLTDRVPDYVEVAAPKGYNPSREKNPLLKVKQYSNRDIYSLGIKRVDTMFGNAVYSYDEGRMICDLIKYRNKYDGESFIKAMRLYVEHKPDQTRLFDYARKLHVEEKVFEVMELLLNDD